MTEVNLREDIDSQLSVLWFSQTPPSLCKFVVTNHRESLMQRHHQTNTWEANGVTGTWTAKLKTLWLSAIMFSISGGRDSSTYCNLRKQMQVQKHTANSENICCVEGLNLQHVCLFACVVKWCFQNLQHVCLYVFSLDAVGWALRGHQIYTLGPLYFNHTSNNFIMLHYS